MVDTVTGSVAGVVVPSESLLTHFWTACNNAAKLIYADVAAVETKITEWRSDNPALAPLFNQGVTFVEEIFETFAVGTVPGGGLVVKAIGAALKGLAAADSSMSTTTPMTAVVNAAEAALAAGNPALAANPAVVEAEALVNNALKPPTTS